MYLRHGDDDMDQPRLQPPDFLIGFAWASAIWLAVMALVALVGG